MHPRNNLSVIIITLNEERNLPNLLNDLIAQSYQQFEVIVVDSMSTDSTVSVAESYKDRLSLSTVVMSSRGVSLGRNTGAANANCERLLFLDADVRLKPDFLERSLNYLEKKQLLISGGRIGSCGNDGWEIRAGMALFDWGMMVMQYVFPTSTGACIFSSRIVHEKIGGFDLSIQLCEDCDYVSRASKSFRYRMLPYHFGFNSRRLKQDGLIKTGFTYLRANTRRLFIGELRNNEIEYKFGHYKEKQ
ncbi:glycosyl transferase [Pelistega indica]|uniref:Glycosyl transferase n=1 Tax=Pelistega indica TaxID=1414851 RepID=V8FV14_9BURK|nr:MULTISPECIES: glycosyltransferase [Pelistega]ETD67272.1 glycosyl transferase [Pelistega indica]